MSVTIVARKYWATVSPTDPLPLTHPVNYVLSHAVAAPACYTDTECRAVVRRLVDPKRGDTVYSFLVGGNGWVYECSGFHAAPQLQRRVSAVSSKTLYIGLIGHFEDDMPEIILDTRQALIDYGVSRGLITPNYVFAEGTPPLLYKEREPKQKNTLFFQRRKRIWISPED